MPTGITKALLTDIGTEELAHLEMIGTMFYQLTKNASVKELEEAGLSAHYVQHGRALFLHDAAGVPWTAAFYQSMGDPLADLHEDMAAEQKARATYERLICMAKNEGDDGMVDALAFLREREVVHFQRFGEALVSIQDWINSKHVHPVSKECKEIFKRTEQEEEPEKAK